MSTDLERPQPKDPDSSNLDETLSPNRDTIPLNTQLTTTASFDWLIYADATFAGLSVLIPIPIVDWFFERFFRQRMPRSIAARRGRQLPSDVLDILTQGQANQGCLASCVTLPLMGIIWLFKRLSRKILYFLTVKEATDQLSYYWHQAFLLDHLLAVGHLDEAESAQIARRALDETLAAITTSPLIQVAQQLATGPRRLLRALRKARRGEDDDELIETKKSMMADVWEDFADYFEDLAQQYHQIYLRIEAEPEPSTEA
ncbi:MAG: hypothetical protein AAF485_25580 [Chloroflexota bacterium]